MGLLFDASAKHDYEIWPMHGWEIPGRTRRNTIWNCKEYNMRLRNTIWDYKEYHFRLLYWCSPATTTSHICGGILQANEQAVCDHRHFTLQQHDWPLLQDHTQQLTTPTATTTTHTQLTTDPGSYLTTHNTHCNNNTHSTDHCSRIIHNNSQHPLQQQHTLNWPLLQDHTQQLTTLTATTTHTQLTTAPGSYTTTHNTHCNNNTHSTDHWSRIIHNSQHPLQQHTHSTD